MPSGDVRDVRAKSRPQPRRALWQAGQSPCAPRLGVGGPAPGVGGAGATSGPDVSPQPHPGGAGYRRRRPPRGAARAEGRGSWSAHLQDRAVARPRAWRGGVTKGRRRPHWSLGPRPDQSGQQEEPTPPRGLRATMGVPLAGLEEGRKLKLGVGHADARRPKAVGRGGAAALPPPRGPRGVFPARPFVL